ncbi:MAG TPA: hypothetical protein VGF99_15265 [Myxococcota bacterium]
MFLGSAAAPAHADDDPPIVIVDDEFAGPGALPSSSSSSSTPPAPAPTAPAPKNDDDAIVIVDDEFNGPGGTAGTPAGKNDDDIVIVDDVAATDEGGVIHFNASDDDDPIIIVDDGDAPMPSAQASRGPLGQLWDSWHVAIDSEVFGSAQLTDVDNGPFRLLGSLWLESWLLPAPNLSFYGNAVGRLAFDGTPEGRVTGFLDVYELYAKITLPRGAVQIGRLVVPWGRTQALGFGDRLQPADLRRGAPFPDPVRQKQPQLGAQLKGSLDVVGVEAVGFVSYEPGEGALTAANQGGVRLGRYQTALARSPTLAGGLLTQEDTAAIRHQAALAQPTLALRAWRRFWELDITGSVAMHFDETPTLTLAPGVGRVLASEGLALRGVAPEFPAPLPPCGGGTELSCIGGVGALSYAPTTSVAVDASWGLGIVIARAEGVFFPRIADQAGKTALVIDGEGLRSIQTSQAAMAVAVEGQLGPFFDGSLELFDVLWAGVPGDARLWGVELLEPGGDVASLRTVHRFGGAASLSGALFEERVQWKLRGEAGFLQQDILMSAEVRYLLPVFDLYVGGRGDLFAGRPGSPGWMRQEATSIGIFLGESS